MHPDRMHPDPDLRRDMRLRLRRAAGTARRAPPHLVGRAALGWLASAALLAGSFLLTARAQHQAGQARRAYGETEQVWVLRRAVEAGVALQPDDVLARSLPRALLPDGAVPATDAIVGRRARVALSRGEVVLGGRLSDRAGPAVLAGPGRLAVAVPDEHAPPGLQLGDEVAMLFAEDDPSRPGPTATRSLGATVVGLEPDAGRIVVALSAADATRLVAPLLRGELVVALATPSG